MRKLQWPKALLITSNILPFFVLNMSCSTVPQKPIKILPKNIDGSDWEGVDSQSQPLVAWDDYEIDAEEQEVIYKDCTKLISNEQLVIPNYVYVNGAPFKVLLDNGCFYQSNISGSVELNDFITFIPDRCFFECYYLQTIIMHNPPTSIGTSAFESCGTLKFFFIKYGTKLDENWAINLETLGNRAFYDTDLSFNKQTTKFVFGPNFKSLGEYCFYGCRVVYTDFSLCNKLKEIPDKCFFGCLFLSKVWFPASMEKIGDSAFSSDRQLTDIVLPIDGMGLDLSGASFSNCDKFKGFSRECKLSTVKDGGIPESAFENCVSLITKPWVCNSGISRIGYKSLYNTSFTYVELGTHIKDIGEAAFGHMEQLQIIDFSEWPYDTPPSWTAEDIFPEKPTSGLILLPGQDGQYHPSWREFLLNIGFKEEELVQTKWQIQAAPE